LEELIRLGAYRTGSDPEADQAMCLQPAFEAFLAQDKEDTTGPEEGHGRPARIFEGRTTRSVGE
jgi:flagellum-specific ATP synthase